LLDELLVTRRDHGAQVARRSLLRYPSRHDHIYPERPAVGVLVHPAEYGIQFGRVVEPDAAEHAEPAGPADRRGDVLGRGESVDRVLDAEQVTQRGTHGHAVTFAGGCAVM